MNFTSEPIFGRPFTTMFVVLKDGLELRRFTTIESAKHIYELLSGNNIVKVACIRGKIVAVLDYNCLEG